MGTGLRHATRGFDPLCIDPRNPWFEQACLSISMGHAPRSLEGRGANPSEWLHREPLAPSANGEEPESLTESVVTAHDIVRSH